MGESGGQRDRLEARVRAFIRRHDMLAAGPRLVVAVSGGPDSVCLLSILASLREDLGLALHVAHLDHQLRGADSLGDARFVEQLSRRLGLPATVEGRDVKAYRARRRISLEEAAREVRYSFLAEVAARTAAASVAVGHTTDDNVETILMHLVRGTGTRGLGGLLPVTPLRTAAGTARVVRPLLEISRAETARFCSEHGLEVREDASNRSFSPFRNRIRLELVPLLRNYNPRVDEALLRTARMAADEEGFLEAEADRAWEGVAARDQGMIAFARGRFLSLSPALKRQLLRKAMGELIGDLKDVESRHIQRLLEAADGPSGRTFQMPGGLEWVVEHDRCLLGRDTTVSCPLPVLGSDSPLNIPGDTNGPSWLVKASVVMRKAGSPVTPAERRGEPGWLIAAPPGVLKAFFDFDRVGDRLVVRRTRPGDRFRPLGLGQSKKVGEFMLDARIPRSWRQRVPIVVSGEQVVWVVGWRIDETVKVTEGTQRVLIMEFRRAGRSS